MMKNRRTAPAKPVTTKASGAVLTAVAGGELTPIEAMQIMGLVDSYRRTLEITELEARVAALEAV